MLENIFSKGTSKGSSNNNKKIKTTQWCPSSNNVFNDWKNNALKTNYSNR